MNGTKNLVLVALCLVAVALGYISWQEYIELQRLRAAVVNADQLEHRATTAEKRVASLQAQLSATTKRQSAAAGDEQRDDGGPGERPGVRGRAMMVNAASMMDRPEVQKMMALQQKAMLDARFAALFKKLGLSPDKLDQLKALMLERQQVGSDVFSAAAKQGLDPMQNRAELSRLTAEGQAKVDSDIKSLLGDTDFDTYENYQTTLPQRTLVNQLQQSLSYTANPLSESQAEQLVQILAQNQPARAPDGAIVARTMVIGGGPDMGFVGPGGSVMGSAITDAAVQAAHSVLNDAQVNALQEVQNQQAQMRSAMQAMRPGRPPGGG